MLWYNKAKEAGIETYADYLKNLLPRMWSTMYNEAKEAGIDMTEHYLFKLHAQTVKELFDDGKLQD